MEENNQNIDREMIETLSPEDIKRINEIREKILSEAEEDDEWNYRLYNKNFKKLFILWNNK